MSRTKKDINVAGRTAEEVRTSVQTLFNENNINTIESTANSIKGRWGIGFLTAAKYFQVSFAPMEGGVIAQTEGWVSVYGVSEQDFKQSAMSAGGIPRKEGWKAMERLWSVLESLSSKP